LPEPHDIHRQKNEVEDQNRLDRRPIAVQDESQIARDRDGAKRNQPLHAEGGQHQAGRKESQPVDFCHRPRRDIIEEREMPLSEVAMASFASPCASVSLAIGAME
jgi:hypothetical protein